MTTAVTLCSARSDTKSFAAALDEPRSLAAPLPLAGRGARDDASRVTFQRRRLCGLLRLLAHRRASSRTLQTRSALGVGPQMLLQDHPFRLESLLGGVDCGVRVGVSAHENVERRIASLGP